MTIIFGIKLLCRTCTATDFQEVMTKYGCSIKTRMGLHDVEDGVCSPSGIIVVEFIGDDFKEFEDDIKALGDVIIQKMEF